MSQSPKTLKFDAKQAARSLPELERIAEELLRTIDHCEALSKSFRKNFLKIFQGPEIAVDPGNKKWAALRSVHFHVHANLANPALAQLRYAADLADLACGLLNLPAED